MLIALLDINGGWTMKNDVHETKGNGDLILFLETCLKYRGRKAKQTTR